MARKRTGSIQKRGETSWRIRYYSNNVRQYETIQGTLEDAQDELAKRLGNIAEGLAVSSRPNTVLFEELASDVITDYEVNGQKSKDDVDTRFQKHILPVFGKRKAAQITAAQIKTYIVSRKNEGAPNSTINRELAAMKRAFNLAVEGRKLMIKPHVTMLREDNVREGFFTRDEVDRVASHLKPTIGRFVLFAFLTAWRFGEIRDLTWGEVDFAAGEIRINPGRDKNREGRVFPMTDELRALLEAQRAKKDASRRVQNAVRPMEATFSAKRVFLVDGEKVGSFPKSWARACYKAGLPCTLVTEDFVNRRTKKPATRIKRIISSRIFHDLRRSGVREFVRNGIPERVAMKLTGHKSRSVFDRYNIVSDADLRAAAETLNRAKIGASGANVKR